MTANASTFDTQDGPLSVIVDSRSVLASGWTSQFSELLALIDRRLRPVGMVFRESDFLGRVEQAVRGFYAGDCTAPSMIPVHQHGGPFHRQVWDCLRDTSVGQHLTYSELAQLAGNSRAVRAAGAACATNAAALFIPCHRVLRSDKTLGGFRYGLEIKQSLLNREARSI